MPHSQAADAFGELLANRLRAARDDVALIDVLAPVERLAGLARRGAHLGATAARGLVRTAWWAAAAVLFGVFACWPQFWNLGQSGVTPAGLVWYAPGTYFGTGSKPWYHEFHWHGLQLLAGNSFVLAGLASLAALAVAAAVYLARGRPREPGELSP